MWDCRGLFHSEHILLFFCCLLGLCVLSYGQSPVCLRSNTAYPFLKYNTTCSTCQKANSGPVIPCVSVHDLSEKTVSLYSYLGTVHSVSDEELWDVLYNNTVQSFCALVLFHAPACPFSAKAGPTYNALGRTFQHFPVLAINVDKYSSATRDYIIAYYPSLVLYYDGKVAKRFDPLSELPKLLKGISDITGISLKENVTVTEEDFEGPLPTKPVGETDWLLLLAALYTLGVLVVVPCSWVVFKFVR